MSAHRLNTKRGLSVFVASIFFYGLMNVTIMLEAPVAVVLGCFVVGTVFVAVGVWRA